MAPSEEKILLIAPRLGPHRGQRERSRHHSSFVSAVGAALRRPRTHSISKLHTVGRRCWRLHVVDYVPPKLTAKRISAGLGGAA